MPSRLAEPGCPVRWPDLCRDHIDWRLLQTGLSGANGEARALPVLWFGGGGAGGGFSALFALPSGDGAGYGVVAGDIEYCVAGAGPDQ